MTDEQLIEGFARTEHSTFKSQKSSLLNKKLIDKAKADAMRTDFENIGLGVFHPRLKTEVGGLTRRIKGFAFPKREVELALYGTSNTPELECDEVRTDHSGIFLAFGKHLESDGGGITLILYGIDPDGNLIEDTDPSRIFDFSQLCPDNCPNGIKFPNGPECMND